MRSPLLGSRGALSAALALACASGCGRSRSSSLSVEDLGIPATPRAVIASVVHDGLVFATVFETNGEGRLIVAGAATSEQSELALPGTTGAYALAVDDASGIVYVGTFRKAELWRYRLAERVLERVPDPGALLAADSHVFGLAVGAEGRVYLGTYPTGRLLAWDPKASEWHDFGQPVPGRKYLRQLYASPGSGRVICALGTPAAVAAFDASTARFSVLRDASLSDATFATLSWQDGRVVAALGEESLEVATEQPPSAARGSGLTPAVIGADGRYEVQTRSGLRTGEIDLRPTQDGMMTMGLFAGPDGLVYGATYWNTWLFRVPATGDGLEPLGRVAGATGEFRVGQASDDRHILLPGYVGQLFVYDVRSRWRGETPDPNPRPAGSLGDGQHLAFGTDRRADGLIAVVTPPTYGHVGGAVSIFGPDLERRLSVVRPAGEQALYSVTFGPEGLLFVGTSNESGPGAGKVEGDARLLTLSPDDGTVLDMRVPVRGATMITGLVAIDDERVLGSTDTGYLFTFELRAERVVLLDLKPGHVRGLARWPEEDAILGLAWKRGVFLLDPGLQTLRFIEGAPERTMPGIAFDGSGRAHVHDGVRVYRIGRQ